MSAQPILDYLTKAQPRSDQFPQDPINMLDNLLKWINKEQYTLIKKSLFNEREMAPEFVIFKGFTVSVRPQWKLRLNADLVNSPSTLWKLPMFGFEIDTTLLFFRHSKPFSLLVISPM